MTRIFALLLFAAIAAAGSLAAPVTVHADDDWKDYWKDMDKARKDYWKGMRKAEREYWDDREDAWDDYWDWRRKHDRRSYRNWNYYGGPYYYGPPTYHYYRPGVYGGVEVYGSWR